MQKVIEKAQEIMPNFNEWCEKVEAIKECPFPKGCITSYFGYPESDKGMRYKDIFLCTGDSQCTGDIKCPVISDNCAYVVGKQKDRAERLCMRAARLDMLDEGDLLSPDISMAISVLDDKEKPIQIISGGTGRGKDLAFMVDVLKSKLPVYRLHWYKAPRLFNMGSYMKAEYVDLLEHANITLVIEDIGTEPEKYTSGASPETIMQQIIDEAAGRRWKLYMSTNLDKRQFYNKYGDRVASRIAKYGQFHIIPDSERDYRRKA